MAGKTEKQFFFEVQLNWWMAATNLPISTYFRKFILWKNQLEKKPASPLKKHINTALFPIPSLLNYFTIAKSYRIRIPVALYRQNQSREPGFHVQMQRK
jgi:hypothetical protein